ncbi:type VI secretion system accessory protein TagJ [Pirellulales bacterium]|nr:type VI secretion system accessory protein TagJ [Pirellulales bacterium]
MSTPEALRNGDVGKALEELFDQVRNEPDEPRHRIFLFQLLCVAGQWDRALTQLNVARDLDPSSLVMAQAYQEILQCEVLRAEVFAGKRTPLIFGDPEPWLAQMLEALQLEANGQGEAAQQLRGEALDSAPAVEGSIAVRQPGELGAADETTATAEFTWIADGDSRLGPLLEMIVNGNYYWAPFHRIHEITFETPSDLRDLVWMPAQFRWANEGEAVGVIPTRYVGSEAEEDGAVKLARKTSWKEIGDGAYHGIGQRVFYTEAGEYGLLDVRRITLG